MTSARFYFYITSQSFNRKSAYKVEGGDAYCLSLLLWSDIMQHGSK